MVCLTTSTEPQHFVSQNLINSHHPHVYEIIMSQNEITCLSSRFRKVLKRQGMINRAKESEILFKDLKASQIKDVAS